MFTQCNRRQCYLLCYSERGSGHVPACGARFKGREVSAHPKPSCNRNFGRWVSMISRGCDHFLWERKNAKKGQTRQGNWHRGQSSAEARSQRRSHGQNGAKEDAYILGSMWAQRDMLNSLQQPGLSPGHCGAWVDEHQAT
jgi:hypothetical protein